jgi:hypothetical protein
VLFITPGRRGPAVDKIPTNPHLSRKNRGALRVRCGANGAAASASSTPVQLARAGQLPNGQRMMLDSEAGGGGGGGAGGGGGLWDEGAAGRAVSESTHWRAADRIRCSRQPDRRRARQRHRLPLTPIDVQVHAGRGLLPMPSESFPGGKARSEEETAGKVPPDAQTGYGQSVIPG